VDLFKVVAALVHTAEEKMFGCTFVVDLADSLTSIAGQSITPSIDLKQPNKLELAAGLEKVDGALHISADLHLHGFACLLDGPQVDNEDRARGARYNSALRFTAQHKQVIVVVVSSDRPVSIFLQGEEIINRYSNASINTCALYSTPLEEWLETGE
jgi:DNA integrity scanning protein DisA with diadenylate cyclase activity